MLIVEKLKQKKNRLFILMSMCVITKIDMY